MRILAIFLFVVSVPASFSADSGIAIDLPVGKHFLAAHGRYAWAGGFADEGWEIWAGALQIASHVQPEFHYQGEVAVISASRVLARIKVSPFLTCRVYVGPDFTVEENIWVPPDQPAVFFRYIVHSSTPLLIAIRFQPSLDLMWPGAIGGQSVRWDAARSAYLFSEPTQRFAAIVYAPGATAHDEPRNDVRLSQSNNELALTLNSETPQIAVARVQGEPPSMSASFDTNALDQLFASSQQEAAKHYESVLASNVRIETPDEDLNRTLAWAEIDLDQDWFCNDRLGCGYIAGFGPSRRDRRPQYAWYFAGDGIVALQAAMAIGDLERARDELRFLANYQDKNTGMMWHEISQSAPYVDWQNKYPYMFIHADLAYPYISAVAEYIRRSNDRKFLDEIWPSVQKAFEYGRSLVSEDGLPRIPKEKEGASEQQVLTDDIGLAAAWIRACGDYSFLADLLGDARTAQQTEESAEKARTSFDRRYWDTQGNFAIQGYRLNGAPVTVHGVSALVAVRAHLFAEPRAQRILDEIASWRFQSDWGTRGLAIGEPGFNPNGYVDGSVSALRTAEVADAYWMSHRPVIAFQIWSALIPWSWLDSPGHMDELLRGTAYYPQSESVPEQTWSTAGFLSAAIHGLFGLAINCLDDTITLAPHLPANWDHASLSRVRMGNSELSFAFQQSVDNLTVRVENSGSTIHLAYDPSIPLGAGDITASVNGKRVSAHVESHSQDESCNLLLDIPHGSSEIEIHYDRGIGVILPVLYPAIAEPSSAMRLTSMALDGNVLRLSVELLPGRNNIVHLLTTRAIRSVTNGEVKKLSGERYEVTVRPAETQDTAEYHRQQVEVSFGLK